MSSDFIDDGACFVCGKKNPSGLKLEFALDPVSGTAETELRFPRHLQGWKSIVHGGLVATVLDEVMIYAAGAAGFRCATGEISVRYLKPVATESPVRFRARVTGRKSRLITAEAEAVDVSGRTAARASGKLIIVEEETRGRTSGAEKPESGNQ